MNLHRLRQDLMDSGKLEEFLDGFPELNHHPSRMPPTWYRMDNFSRMQARHATDDLWREWCLRLPLIEFKPGWKVRVVPPFGGAIIRFQVRDGRTKGEWWTSVYFDAYGRIGSFREGGTDVPYWEVYPVDGGDPARCAEQDVEGLVELIQLSLDELAE